MQNDPNNRPYYYTPPRAAGRLIGQRPSNAGLWTLFKQQSQGIKIGIITIGVLFTILLLLIPYALFSGIFPNTQNDSTAQNPQNTTIQNIPTAAAIVTDTPTPVVADTPTDSATNTPTPMTSEVTPTRLAVDQPVTTNPWGYDFKPGSFITAPPPTFCNYFSCINGFWNGQGYTEECQDGMYTLGGGVNGDCDAHGGDLRPLYYHPTLTTSQPVPTPKTVPTAIPKTTPTAAPDATPTPKPKRSKATPTPTN